jgi:hypothetical protein
LQSGCVCCQGSWDVEKIPIDAAAADASDALHVETIPSDTPATPET